jgi:hypothetical protein
MIKMGLIFTLHKWKRLRKTQYSPLSKLIVVEIVNMCSKKDVPFLAYLLIWGQSRGKSKGIRKA